jgi:class 3 adenylate cyclase
MHVMLKSIPILVFTLFLSLNGYAQSIPNPKILVLTDSMSGEFIGDYFYFFKERNQKLSIDSVTRPACNKYFEKSNLERSNFGNQEFSVWNKFTVTNQTDHEWMFDIGVYTIDTLTVYYPNKDGTYRVVNSGRFSPFKEKKYKSNSFLFDLDIPKGDTITIYFRIHAYIMQYPTQVYVKEDYINIAHERDIVSGLFIGLMIIMIFYNFFIWLSTRDLDYLFYTIYNLLATVYVFEINGIAHEYFFVGPFNILHSHGPLIVALTSIADVSFSIKFLETQKHAKKINFVLRYLLIPALVGVCVLDVLNLKLLASIANQSLGLVAITFLVLAGIYSYRSGLLSAKYYLLAKGFYFTGAILFVLKTFAILPFNSFYNHSLEAGMAMEMIFFSFALAGKINQYKKERKIEVEKNQKLIKEQNVVLEQTVKERTKELNAEKELTDELLLNILPLKVANELKQKGEASPRHYKMVTVLFTDFKSFTKTASSISPLELIQTLNQCFSAFDDIIEKHHMEKIKTIGDAYMCAGGVPEENNTNAVDAVLAALEINNWVNSWNGNRESEGLPKWEIRIGVHTGELIAGVIGKKKFAYDVWGDAVNLASRLENTGEAGKINISGDTYQLVKDKFNCTYRGQITAKGKGDVDMYFVTGKI